MADDKLKSAWNGAEETEDLFEQFMPDDGFKARTRRREPEVQIVEKEVVVEVPVAPNDALLPGEGDSVEAKGYKITPTGLIRYDHATYEDWLQVGETLLRLDRGIQFAIGDWMLDGERSYGMSNEAVAEAVGRDLHTIENYIWVARAMPRSLRKERLFFGHHALVAGMGTDDEKWHWLNRAEAEEMSVEQLRQAISAPKQKKALPDPDDPVGARDFSKRARKVAGAMERAIGEGNLSKKKALEVLEEIERMKLWLKTAETTMKRKAR